MFLIKPRFNIILFLLRRDGCSTKNNSTPSFFSDAYWFGANAEFSFYYAPLLRKGAIRPADLMSILAREPFAPKHLGKADDPTQAGLLESSNRTRLAVSNGYLPLATSVIIAFAYIRAQLFKWS